MTDNLHNRWPHRWVSRKAEARPSKIEGTGVFAKDKILTGETCGVLGGVIIPVNDIEEYRSKMTQVGIQIDDGFFIAPTSREELEELGVFNHSCEPNMGFSNSLAFVAIRDIHPGEELVFDYAFCETVYEGFDCRCNTNTCRKRVTANDWKNKDIQEKYLKYFSPYLRNKIDKPK